MQGEPEDPLEAGLRIARTFDAHAIPYALGGALAYGLWAIPRATLDVDINVFVPDEKLGHVCDALTAIGATFDRAQALRGAELRGMMLVHLGRYRVDVFTPSIEFAWEAARTRVAQDVDGERIYFLSAEALSVFKLLFFRPKDIVDLQRLLAVRGTQLDRGYIRQHIVDMMGEGDERVRKWDELSASA